MKKLALLVSGLFLAASLSLAVAQDQEDEGTYIDNFGPKDSSYTQNDLLDFSDDATEDEGGNTGMIVGIIAAVAVIGGGAYFMTKKKK